jgi:hypothetical protein
VQCKHCIEVRGGVYDKCDNNSARCCSSSFSVCAIRASFNVNCSRNVAICLSFVSTIVRTRADNASNSLVYSIIKPIQNVRWHRDWYLIWIEENDYLLSFSISKLSIKLSLDLECGKGYAFFLRLFDIMENQQVELRGRTTHDCDMDSSRTTVICC